MKNGKTVQTDNYNLLKAIASYGVAAALIILFTYSSYVKLYDIWLFKLELSYQPFPGWLQSALVWIVPAILLIAIVFLFIENTRKLGFYLSLFIFAFFDLYAIAILLNFFGTTPCGCAGVIKSLTWPQHLF